ncbi:uncharacterized protein LOC131215132 [Anopheles bellator]|uniref:uncharacterized protein LOC131215132 n=1 Tax=Anopheles bellator TaxID=139047 RepID=UPI002648FFB7|nr:uncharacterized protein LOC131215132 [Anopheles bellator]
MTKYRKPNGALLGALALLLLVVPGQAGLILFPVDEADPVIESFCEDVAAGIFPHPSPALCHVYISCTFEEPTVYQCDDGFVFDPSSLLCVPGDREQCVDPSEPDWVAMCLPYSYAFFPDPTRCWRFVLCARQAATVFTCLDGEVWSVERDACLPGDRDTCEVFDPSNVCQGQPDGLVPHPDRCTQFIRCTDGQATVESCPRGEVWVVGGQQCVVGNTDTCEPAVGLCQGVVGNDLLPHPNECHLFVFCSQDTGASVLICPPGEIFRPDIPFCVPGDRETCEYSSVETACVGRPDGVVPHPDSCVQVILCTGGVPQVLDCMDGYVFDPHTGRCAEGDPETCLVTAGRCSNLADGTILVHPLRCDMFLRCQTGTAEVHLCPAGEILDIAAQFCVPGNGDTCERFPLETMCDGREEGGLLLPHPTDCTLYVECRAGGVVVEGSCPTGTIFVAPEQTCRLGGNCTQLEWICGEFPDGTVLEHPDHCDHFILCTGGQPALHPCPPGEILRQDAQFCVPGRSDTCEFDALEDMCRAQPDNTLFPHPVACYLSVRCLGGITTIERCPAGSIYDAPSRSCVVGDQATCERHSNLCDGLPNGAIPHPTECVSYIACKDGQMIVWLCPPGYVFKESLGLCAIGNTELCTLLDDGVCSGLPDDTILAHPNECHLFLRCSWGHPLLEQCPVGEILFAEQQFCVPGAVDTCQRHPVESMCQGVQDDTIYPHPDGGCTEYVVCTGDQPGVGSCGAGHIFHAPSGSCRPGNTDTCRLLGGVCGGQPDGTILEHPNLCGHFVRCAAGEVELHECPAGEILRPDAQFCVPGNADTCTFEPQDSMCLGRPDGLLYPHPTDCGMFVRCEGGSAVLEWCRPGTIYRAASQTCVAGDANTCQFLDGFCAGLPDAVHPHPGGCELFLMCTSGITTAFRCPDGEILHPEHLVCVDGNAGDCSLAPVTTEPPIISVCEGRPDGNYTHPLLCYLFIRCTDGQTDILTCPPDHIFVGAIRDCAPGDQATCIPGVLGETDQGENVCDGLLVGIVMHPSSCYKYYSCYREEATEETCPTDTIFDLDEITCVPGNQETCRKEGDAVPLPSDMCRGIVLGTMLHPEDCTKYVSCLLGSAREHSCRQGFIFSERLFVCLPGDPNSCVVTLLPTTSTIAPEDILPIPSDICRQNSVSFGTLPHPQFCTRYILCALWIPIERECDRFQVFSERLSMCLPGLVNSCRPIIGR